MKTLPNNVTVFNSTPHPVTFWMESWAEPISVSPDELINAQPTEKPVKTIGAIEYVTTEFCGTDEGRKVIEHAYLANNDVIIVGSIIAAQAYPGDVVAMVPCAGYERVAPAEKRMRPDKFTVYPEQSLEATKLLLSEAVGWSYGSQWSKESHDSNCALIEEARKELGL